LADFAAVAEFKREKLNLDLVTFYVHALVSAVGFYEKLGHKTVSGEFSEVGIPHVEMEKIRIGRGE